MAEHQVQRGNFRDRMKLAASILAGQSRAEDDAPREETVFENISKLQYLKVFSFLEQVQLDPVPDHYRLAWEYLNGGNMMLREAVNRKLDANGRLSPEIVAEILDECEGQMKVKDLNALVAESETLLAGGFKTLSKSGKESMAYAEVLQSRLDWMRDLDPADQADMPIEAQFKALLKITSQMLQSTKKASESLDQSTKKLSQMRNRLDEANDKAQRDQLTGLPNRWAFEQQFSAATIRAKERFEPLSVAFIDIDHFKQVNDTHGHEAGDRVLQLVAKTLDGFGRGNCHLARHGGEEFVIVLENTSTQEAKQQIDAVREELAERSLVNKDNGQNIGRVTFSAGIAPFNPGEPNRQVLRNADAALYEAKHSGRNKVLIFNSSN
ncbi:MAG: GGDEF domain-containing protein [Blastomonas fulva]|jgi:diguanylate cyclase|uniref:GGDEF domain-containing protein n=1 Tax=Blastomonas TaxID=150203 RepID=UPI0009E7373F|nr:MULTISPECIES: GGDEF domain-containing protein [Blastomonas]MCO5794351.1 GGDEF domain-containing protein [Blastomonas sp.]MDK2755963.1 GGDEF domain-containing protein [Blastomonas fulva]